VSFDLILPFLEPIAGLIESDGVSEIMVNATADQHSRVFVERYGCVDAVSDVGLDPDSLLVAVKNIARTLGEEITEERPLLDARLPDGSRVAAAMPPISLDGITLTIRKFAEKLYSAGELARIGAVTEDTVEYLRGAISDHKSILISGGTSTGKTTMLNALARFIGPEERIVTIEDTAELHLEQPNLVRFEARREQQSGLPGLPIPAVTIRDLVKHALRHRPDRIIVGEVRGGEAFDLLQALNTGHAGTIATIHANSAALAINRLATCVLQAGVDLPYAAIRSSIADSIDLLLHLKRTRAGRRHVAELVEIEGYNGAADQFRLRAIYAEAGRE
jgi:pilus assembly protein CpaF